MAEKEKYITLKQAAELSGYSADYIGQLIRGGKLQGKQVYTNITWMTTEKAILNYLNKETSLGKKRGIWIDHVSSPEFLAKVSAVIAWILLGLVAIFILLLVYIFSVSIDRAINRSYQQRALHQDRAV